MVVWQPGELTSRPTTAAFRKRLGEVAAASQRNAKTAASPAMRTSDANANGTLIISAIAAIDQ